MKTPLKNQHVIARKIDNEILLLNEENSEIHQLNQTATLIWEFCNGENTIDDIIEALAGTYNVESTKLSDDVDSIINSLKDLGLLE